MFQVVTTNLLKSLNIPIPQFDGVEIPESAIFVGNFGGTNTDQKFYSQSWAAQPSAEFKPMGTFTGQINLNSKRQVTEKLFAFDLQVYHKGWGQYNSRYISCTSFGRTAEMIASITDVNQVISVIGELKANTYVSKKTQEEITELKMFVTGMKFCGMREKRNTQQNNFVPSVDKAEIAF